MRGKRWVLLPDTDVHLNEVRSYVEKIPDADYRQASEGAREKFRDMKFGVRVHWGLYTQWRLQEESWPFLKMDYERRQRYQDLYREFNPKGFSAEGWMQFFVRAGFRCFAFTTKHHDGFSLFDTNTRVRRRVRWSGPDCPKIEECDLAYSVMETPYRRDIVGELCDAARRHGIRIDLYYSHPDWYDADFRPYCFHPLTVPDPRKCLTAKEIGETAKRYGTNRPYAVHWPTDQEREGMVDRHRRQLVELLTNYGKIDMVCLDMWLGADVWPRLRETMKMLRRIQPDVMFRARGIGNYGDYYTPEGFVPGGKENTDMPWMVIYPLAQSFSYDPNGDNYKGSEWVLTNLVDAVAKGGNFMVGIGPDENGCWHPRAVQDLEQVGTWLARNGEAIYGTRALSSSRYREGDHLYFTRSRDSRIAYALCMRRPGNTLRIRTVRPRSGALVQLLGHQQRLTWRYSDAEGLAIDLPARLLDAGSLPWTGAFALRIETVPKAVQRIQ